VDPYRALGAKERWPGESSGPPSTGPIEPNHRRRNAALIGLAILVLVGIANRDDSESEAEAQRPTSTARAQATRTVAAKSAPRPTRTPRTQSRPEPTSTLIIRAPRLPEPTRTPRPRRTRTPTPEQYEECDPSYPDLCLPMGVGDFNCPDIEPYTNIRVIGRDPFDLDRDHDGVGCET
jgi:hypothetical protein